MNAAASTVAREAADLSGEELRAAILAFTQNLSMEVTPKIVNDFLTVKDVLKPGTEIYVSSVPGQPHTELVEAAKALRDNGFTAVPHVTARSFADAAALDTCLSALAGEAGVTQTLLIAGDQDKPTGPFHSTLQLLETGLFDKHGIRKMGIGGHPEKHPRVAADVLRQAIVDKAAFAERTDAEMYVISQVCFEADAIETWATSIRAAGVTLPVRAGLAGPAKLKSLLTFAVICGVGNSMRALKRQGRSLTKMLSVADPNELVVQLATHNAGITPPIMGAHLFSFGGAARTAKWIHTVQTGKFDLNADKSGFTVSTDT